MAPPPKPPSEVLYDSATALRQVDNILAELGADDSESPTPALSRHDDNPVFRALRECRELIATLRTAVQGEKRDLIATVEELDVRFAALSAAAAAHAAHCPAGLEVAPQSPSSLKSAT